MRILSINIHRCVLEQNERLKAIKNPITKYNINISLFNETNTKWNTINVSRINRVMKSKDKGV